MRLEVTVVGGGGNTTGLVIPPEVVDALGGGRRPAVTVTIGELTYRSSIASMGGRYLLPVSAERRAATGVAAGDEIQIDLELDTEPRQVVVPPELAEALGADDAARAAFDALSYSAQSRHVLSVDGTTNPETKRRRVDKVTASLRP